MANPSAPFGSTSPFRQCHQFKDYRQIDALFDVIMYRSFVSANASLRMTNDA